MKFWTKSKIEALAKQYPYDSNKVLAERFGVSEHAIKAQAAKYRLKKDPQHLKKLREEGIGFFAKGHVPANKGKKMPPEVVEKCKATQFKKGHLPHNTLHDGAVSVRKDSAGNRYTFIRVGASTWMHLHLYVWEQAFGKIPKNQVIRFKDGNQLNCSLSNLEMVPKRIHLFKNRVKKELPPEAQEAGVALYELKHHINKKEQDA